LKTKFLQFAWLVVMEICTLKYFALRKLRIF